MPNPAPPRFHLTTGPDHLRITEGNATLLATSDTLSPGDTLLALPGTQVALVLQGGGQFDLAAPARLSGIRQVYDHGTGVTHITLRAGLSVTLHLGNDDPVVTGARDGSTILGGNAGFDTVLLGSSAETVIAGRAAMQVTLPADCLGAHIEGGGVTNVTLQAAPGESLALGAALSGIATLSLDTPELALATDQAGIGQLLLETSHDQVTAGPGTAAILDYAGANRIGFTRPGQSLILPGIGQDGGLTETVTAVQPGDTITLDLPEAATRLAYDPATGVATLTDTLNGGVDYLMLPSGLATPILSVAPTLPNGDSGTLLTLQPAEVPCFAPGTLLATDRGLVPVELLRVGDRLTSPGGLCHPIRWIGTAHIDCTTHPAPDRVRPVRILAGAFAPGLPSHDVILSPDHGLFEGGVLIPVKYLVNGATIRTENWAQITYRHVELDRHLLFLAAGLPVESYLDTGNRHQFAAHPAHPAHPGATPPAPLGFGPTLWPDTACAPLDQDGPILRALRRRLLARADRLGYLPHSDPALRVIANGQPVPGDISGGIWSATLPPDLRQLGLVSRAASPADCDPDSTDYRRLGIGLRGVTLVGRHGARRADPFGPFFGPGFHPPETDRDGSWRWTDGCARFTPALWSGLTGPLRLMLHLHGGLRYRPVRPGPYPSPVPNPVSVPDPVAAG